MVYRCHGEGDAKLNFCSTSQQVIQGQLVKGIYEETVIKNKQIGILEMNSQPTLLFP